MLVWNLFFAAITVEKARPIQAILQSLMYDKRDGFMYVVNCRCNEHAFTFVYRIKEVFVKIIISYIIQKKSIA